MEVGFYESIFISALVAFIGFIAYRVYLIESNHLKHIEEDMAEVKNDIKWLIAFHEKENKK
jgi:Na+/melibiose symporter-like transporter